ncbi:hypothetical protein ACXR2U_20765 [Jatrophihabitans sp. YIM 134969]
MFRRTVIVLGIAGGLAASLAVAVAPRADAATVPPGSIVYLRGDNIWIARADGSRARAVTTDGAADRPYTSPSEADDGTIAAGRLGEIVRMTQQGQVLNRIDPPPLRLGSGHNADGTPADVAISPDGRYIAWSFVQYDCDPTCLVRYATGYTLARRLDTSVGAATQYHAPSWIGTNRTLQSGGYNVQVMLQNRLAAPVHWFDDHQVYADDTDLADAELSRNGRFLGLVRGYGANSTVLWYQVDGDARHGTPPGPPTPLCVTNADAKAMSPTFAPDSSAMAWSSSEGVYVKAKPGRCSVQPKLVLPGASRPMWSAARLV